MQEVSQAQAQKRRPWTAQEQLFAEVAAGCGVSLGEMGRVLGRHPSIPRSHLNPVAAEKIRQKNSAHYNSNPEKQRERSRLYRITNPNKCRKATQRWRTANPDKVREHKRRSYKKNPAKAIERARVWNKANPDKMREVRRVCARRRYNLKRASQRKSLLPATSTAIAERFALWRNRCAFCGVDANHPRNCGYKRLTEEHVIALTQQGLDEADNLMPACHACNSGKNDRPVETWYRAQPFFTEARWRKIQRHCPAAVMGQLPLALPA